MLLMLNHPGSCFLCMDHTQRHHCNQHTGSARGRQPQPRPSLQRVFSAENQKGQLRLKGGPAGSSLQGQGYKRALERHTCKGSPLCRLRHLGPGAPPHISQTADVAELRLRRLSARSEASGASSDGKEAEPDQAARPTTPPHIMPPLNGLAEGVSCRKVRYDWADSGLKRLPHLAAQADLNRRQ